MQLSFAINRRKHLELELVKRGLKRPYGHPPSFKMQRKSIINRDAFLNLATFLSHEESEYSGDDVLIWAFKMINLIKSLEANGPDRQRCFFCRA